MKKNPMRLLVVYLLLLLHPIHLTVTNVEYLPEEKEFKVSVRVFKDDFAKAIGMSYGTVPDVDDNSATTLNLLKKYVFDNLQFQIDGKEIKPGQIKFLGKRTDGMALWLDYSFKYKKEPSVVVLTNKLMCNLYRDQKNLLIFTYKGNEKAFAFNTKHTKEKIDL